MHVQYHGAFYYCRLHMMGGKCDPKACAGNSVCRIAQNKICMFNPIWNVGL